MNNYFRDIFGDLVKVERIPVNLIGGFALGLLFEMVMPSKSISISFVIGFCTGFIYMNSLVKEIKKINLFGFYCRFAIIMISFLLLYLIKLFR